MNGHPVTPRVPRTPGWSPGIAGPPSGAWALFLLPLLLVLFAPGCRTTQEAVPAPPAAEAKTPAAPSLSTVTLVVAGLDLSGWSGRIEQDRVGELAAVLRREKIDVLAVQGITRYPTLTTRTDFVDELARAMEYRQAFGETISLSGRETGNAVFSAYPIQSSDNRHYDGLSGTGFESAMHALVDAGAREIAFVSTRTPGQPSAADRTRCQQTIDSIAGLYGGGPVVVLGNLASLRPGQGWTDASPGAGASGRVWFTGGGLTGSGSRTVQTVFGPLTVIDLEVSGKPAP